LCFLESLLALFKQQAKAQFSHLISSTFTMWIFLHHEMLEVVVIMINNNCLTWFVDVNQIRYAFTWVLQTLWSRSRSTSFLCSILVIRRFSNWTSTTI
jgi:hypothetical protein